MLNSNLASRRRKEFIFKVLSLGAVTLILAILAGIIGGLIYQATPALKKSFVGVKVYYDPSIVKGPIEHVDFDQLITVGLSQITDTPAEAEKLLSPFASLKLFNKVKKYPELPGQTRWVWIPLSDEVDQFLKHPEQRALPEKNRRVKDTDIAILDSLESQRLIKQRFNWTFFTGGDSREPQHAGIWSSLIGTFYTLLVTLLIAFPIAISSALYLEEFATKNVLVRWIEVSINNLASVPSIIFGLLGLAIFLNVFHLPRSSALVAGLTLAMMTLPTIIVASRSALQTVPKAIRQAAEGMGASPVQVVFHHVLPLALPGMLTGTLLGLARAIGECACLLMIGMVAFIVNAPASPLDATTVLPVQIFNWARNPEAGFIENTSAAILVLLIIVAFMNLAAIVLRRRFEHRW
ncbi:MAG: phosphate ABC transporter permease PstA [Alphaproteobacteria bacterium]